ncbi:MAG TPA: hypothetical protein PLV00_06080 [Caldisericia bacterium]|nr:hypothetical protein [Caldisericia bacterium]
MTIVWKDGERLYLRAWEYNAARIITELANIVENHGGRVKPTNTAIISDRNTKEETEPITVTHTSYISFVLDGTYYYYQVNDNPFFDFYYSKTPIKNGKCSRDAGLEADKKEWLFDCFFGSNCGQQDIIEAANLIFNMLCNAPHSRIIRDKHKQRIANTYNDGWHYETVYVPERLEKVDF